MNNKKELQDMNVITIKDEIVPLSLSKQVIDSVLINNGTIAHMSYEKYKCINTVSISYTMRIEDEINHRENVFKNIYSHRIKQIKKDLLFLYEMLGFFVSMLMVGIMYLLMI